MQLVLHAGVQKTATSYIQAQLRRARAGLRAEGIVVPRFFNEFGLGHHNFASILKGIPLQFTQRRSFSAMGDERRLEILHSCTAPTVVLSSERLFHVPRPALESLAEDSSREIRVVVFIRRRSDLMVSRWRSEVKWQWRPPFHDYVDEALSHPGHTPSMRRPLVKMEQTFGPGSVRVVHYDGAVAAGRDPAELVFEAASLAVPHALETLPEAPRVNESSSMLEAEVMRLVHQRAAENGDGFGGRAILRSLQRLHDEGDERLRATLDHIAARVDGEVSLRRIDEHYLEEDLEIAQTFGDSMLERPEGPLFDTEGHAYRDVARFAADPATDKKLRRLLDELVPALKTALAQQKGPAY